MDNQTSNQALVETPTLTPDWNSVAGKVLAFIRRHELVIAVDQNVWLYSGSSESQLASFLRDIEDEESFIPGQETR